MGGDPPELPNVVEITSATYGSKDFTAFVRTQFDEYYTAHPKARTWTLSATNKTFGDPNPTVYKACVVVWRYTIKIANGATGWSNFKSQGVSENQAITVSWGDASGGFWQPPSPGINGLFVVAAYWFDADRTTNVAGLAGQWANPYKGLVFNVSPGSLGADPNANNTSKQFCVTYGTWAAGNYWDFEVAVGMNIGSWALTLPLCFPPLTRPGVVATASYITFQNRQFGQTTSGTVLYPIIFDLNSRDLVWDGRDANAAIPEGR